MKKSLLLLCLFLLPLNLPADDGVVENAKKAVKNLTKPKKRRTVKSTYFALGPAYLGSLGVTGMGYYLAGGYAFDAGPAVIRVGGSAALNDWALFSQFGIGASYFAMDGDTSPFIGADFGIGLTKIRPNTVSSDELQFGFVISPTVGVHLLRTSDVSLELSLISSFMLKAGPLGSPTLWGFRVGIFF